MLTGWNIEKCVRQALRLAGGSAASEMAGLADGLEAEELRAM